MRTSRDKFTCYSQSASLLSTESSVLSATFVRNYTVSQKDERRKVDKGANRYEN